MPNLEKLEIVLERIVFTPECKWVYQLRFKLDGREFAISRELSEAAVVDLNKQAEDHVKPQTNADYVRSLNDRDLAELLAKKFTNLWVSQQSQLGKRGKPMTATEIEQMRHHLFVAFSMFLRSPHDEDPSFIVFGGRRGEGKVFHLEKVLADKKREVAELRGIMQQTDGVPERICKLDEEIKALEAEISDIRSRWG